MNKAYLLTGGNTGERKMELSRAVALIAAKTGKILKQSHLYETAAWGKTDQSPFLNQALLIETPLSPQALLESILAIELEMGRERKEKYGPRNIDIDILLYNNEIISQPHLHIPHPEMTRRRFVLTPLSEIAPNLIHPTLHLSIKKLLELCPDTLEVRQLG